MVGCKFRVTVHVLGNCMLTNATPSRWPADPVPVPDSAVYVAVPSTINPALPMCARCYKLPLANSAAVPNTLRKEMGGVCKACFAGDSSKLPTRNMQV